MSLDKDLINKLVKVTSRAAINCYQFLGKENKKIADKAATDSMRNDLNNLEINGEVVIGEGEFDEAPMLYIGEKLGKGNGPNLDIAVDPLEGTNFAAKNIPGAISVLAISDKGNLFNAPETYMNKIAVGKDVPFDATDLDYPIKKNISNIAEAKNKNINNFELITPGIRLNIDNKDDQNRIMTPHEAIDNGASKLVIGRSISKAIDPNKALIEIFKSIDSD